MEETTEYQSNSQQPMRPVNAPYAELSLALGIASLVLSGLGIVLGILGLIYSNKGLKIYREHPEQYKGDTLLEVGKVTSIVSISLWALIGGIIGLALLVSRVLD